MRYFALPTWIYVNVYCLIKRKKPVGLKRWYKIRHTAMKGLDGIFWYQIVLFVVYILFVRTF
jgi:hypothetical protein